MAAKTLDPQVYQFLWRYRQLCGERPTAEQALLLQYFTEAGNDLPVFNGRDWFYCAWRKVDIIETRCFNASKDMIVWHLLKLDTVIDQVVEELLPEADPHA
ncbi:hypothetical protein GTB64_004546 [Salmonella enterica]|nr:hypothetical protein [Salmonella enterica]